MHFTTPLALLLLLTLPIFAYLGWPTRGYGRGREITSLLLRLLIVLSLILALAGLELLRGSNQLATVFLVDASDSMPAQAKTAATDYIQTALQDMGPDDQAAIILFGGDALVERPMSPSKELGTFTSIPNTGQTDLAEAIRLGLALYPSGAARRMILLTDGATTAGDAESALNLAENSGVDVIAVPFVFTPPVEVLLTDVGAPDKLLQNERFELQFTVRATAPTQAGIRVLAAGELVYEGTLALEAGTHTYGIPLTAGEPGFTNYELQLTALDDTYYQNNELAAYSQIAGPPKVLLVAPPAGEPLPFQDTLRPDEYTALQTALEFAGFTVEYARPNGLPSELPLLAEYATVVLVDVPARQLNNRQMLALQTYVRDLGGGLVVVGGPTSYGVGGYFKTPLEETLPVDMQIKDEQRRPTLTMVFIIDRSGSMSDTGGGVTKLDLAKEAAARSVEFLFPGDRVGVIAFDDLASWVVPITELNDPNEVTRLIDGISLGGGTDIYAGLLAMSQELPNDPASVKHVILLTDGGANPSGIPELVERMYTDYGITLTTVGVGSDAAPFLEDLARIGNGRYHFTEDPASIPAIFTEETTLATRSYIVEETFFPELASNSPILAGINEVPPLYGYVGTSSKATAQTILVSAQGDPILAQWQYGLGKAVAFTSDASPRWAKDWVAWDGFPAFWAQAIRFTVNQNVDTGLSISVEQDGETAKLIVDAQTDSGLYLNDYTLTANVIDPTGQVQTVELSQVAPGRYEAPLGSTSSASPTEQGAYLIRVDGTSSDGAQTLADLAGWVQAYSPEYRTLQADPDELLNLMTITGGRLTTGDPAEAFAHTLLAPADTRPIWPWLLTLAAILLPFDIAVRRLAVDRRDVSRAWQRMIGRLTPVPAGAPVIPERSERMTTLLGVKERVGEEGTQGKQVDRVNKVDRVDSGEKGREGEKETGRGGEEAKRREGDTKPREAVLEARKAQVFVAPKEASAPTPKPEPKVEEEGDGDGTTTSALLARKRERRQRRE
ncbi:MAG: VWA domain-containing protein [Anaerolineales bacterium]|nr:VWA domain-containing protein [Anaerolineales bacterium]